MLEKTFEPKSIEEKFSREWEKTGAYAAQPTSNAKPFTVMMPPPNVTGSLHIGHALNMSLQDILTRYHRMRGRDALWQPGTDHAGIATQMVVERLLDQEGTTRRKLGREKFLERVWDWKAHSGGTIVGQLKRLGATPDWERERFTMDEGLSRAVVKVFVQLYKEGLIYRDKRLVNWDPKLHTAISDLEVEQKEQKGHMWHIRYPIEGATAEYITVATTRPETMLGDTAVAVHPEDERYKHLVGKFAVLPISNRLIPIVADEYSDPEKGSGAVKITPAHDFNDFEVGKRHNLPMINIFDINAHLNDNVPSAYKGLERYAARKKILAELEELELLDKVEDIKNTVPYGDRSGVVIEPFLTDQWYCDAPTLAKPAIEAVETGKTKFVPKTWENTYYEWMRNIQPWCISRQLWWGHQIPAWYGPDGEVFVAESEEDAYAAANQYYSKSPPSQREGAGGGVTHSLNTNIITPHPNPPPLGEGKRIVLKRDEDVLDTWFSSALWPFSTLGWPDKMDDVKRYYPGDVLVTGFDIIFFWVARMMMFGIHFMDDVPFKDVYIHALVRDAKGQKMSKSKGNVMDPLDLIDKFGADALRFTLAAMAAQGRDIKLSEDRVEGYKHFATKLWNATRYCEINGCLPVAGFNPGTVTFVPNKWIIHSVLEMKQSLEKAIEDYKFNEAATTMYQFVWGTFCDWYLEFTKPVLASGDAAIKKEIQATTGWVLDQILILLNPIMPYITEELYASIAERKPGELLLTTKWPEYESGLKHPAAAEEIDWLIRAISEIRSVRADMNVPAKAMIKLVVKDASGQTQARFSAYEEILKRMARIEQIVHDNNIPKGSIQTVLDEATLALPIAEIIDLDKERERLRKELVRLEGEIRKVDVKLGNEQFVSNAPEDIITEHKERKATAETAHRKFTMALKQLESA